MKKLLISGIVALLVALMVTMAVQAAQPERFDFEKECSTFPLTKTCTIQNSGELPLLNGGILTYLGPVIDLDRFFISSEVLLDLGDGDTAMGHFVFIGDHGYFTFRQGTGSLEGFHARGEIGPPDASLLFALTGTYHFKPVK